MRWQFSVNQILRDYWEDIKKQKWTNTFKIKHLYAIKLCRTKDLGGHIDACEKCAFYKISYNSCGNRHCPTCGALKREEWIARQEEKLLNVPYFHLVFTLPHELNPLCLQHPRVMYSLLFRTAWQTIKAFASDPKYLGAKTGMTAVLHTWGQNLSLHPHLHCIVPGGGLTVQKKWKTTRSDGKYLFPRNAMRKVFKGKFMAELKKLAKQDLIDFPVDLKEKLYRKKWVVYAKRPFAKPQNVIEYLGRYTHKSAISNYRIEKVGNGVVTFKYKVYKKGGKVESMSLPVLEFVRRFALHILPHGFARMRHFGLLSSRGQVTQLPVIQAKMNLNIQKSSKVQIREKSLKRLKSDNTCPCCGHKSLKTILHFPRGEPPDEAYILMHVLKL
jgi:hypothetical protein